MDQEIGWNKLIEQVPECAKEKSSVFSIGWASLLTSFATWVCVSSIANAQGLQPSVDVKPTAGFFDIVFSGGWFGILIMLAIIGLSILAAYLIFGVIFMKFVKKAEGKEMIPNYEFWSSVPSDFKVFLLLILINQ